MRVQSGAMTTLFDDAPIASAKQDVLGRAPLAARVVELVTSSADQPFVIGLLGATGSGKTSVLQMIGEVAAKRDDLRAFSLDGWVADTADGVNRAFLEAVSQIFKDERVISSTEKLRDRLLEVSGVVSVVARFAGAKVDVEGALQRSPDQLREQVAKHAEACHKRILVLVDHLDHMPPAEAVATLKLVARWGTFPYLAFVLALDRDRLARKLRRIEGTADDFARVVTIEVPLTPIDRAGLAAYLRDGIAAIASTLAVDASAALSLFDRDAGIGLAWFTTIRDANRYLNALAALAPLMTKTIDLRAACLVELVREHVPAAYPIVVERLPFARDAESRLRLSADLATYASTHPRPMAAAAMLKGFAR